MDNNYFTPAIEDIHVGYECEILSNYTIHSIAYHKTTTPPRPDAKCDWKQYVVESRHLGNIADYLEVGNLRVPYLTKEQIENEGALLLGVGRHRIERYSNVELHGWAPEFAFKNCNMTYYLRDKVLIVQKVNYVLDKRETLYQGYCKDINTFKEICKLINI